MRLSTRRSAEGLSTFGYVVGRVGTPLLRLLGILGRCGLVYRWQFDLSEKNCEGVNKRTGGGGT